MFKLDKGPEEYGSEGGIKFPIASDRGLKCDNSSQEVNSSCIWDTIVNCLSRSAFPAYYGLMDHTNIKL